MLLATLFTVALTASSSSSAVPEVELRAYARTPGARIQLGDVVTESSKALLTGDLLETDLGRSPSKGFRRKLDIRAIRAAIPEQVLRITGPTEVSVETDMVHLDPDRIIAAAREELLNSVPVGPDTELELTRSPRETTVPRGRDGIEFRARLSGTPRARGAVPVSVEVRIDGRTATTMQISFLLRTYSWAPILTTDLARGEPLSRSDFEMRRIETTRMTSLPMEDATPLLGQVTRRALRAGGPLSGNDFQMPQLVERNQPVTIRYQRGALIVEAFGIAKDHGRLGEMVRIENLRTRKVIYGRVVAAGRVEMTP